MNKGIEEDIKDREGIQGIDKDIREGKITQVSGYKEYKGREDYIGEWIQGIGVGRGENVNRQFGKQ